MSMEPLLRELNESQRNAATVSNTHTLVLAGAGCGKTKTIIARAAYLISEGTPPERIQILTFTRRSASEIVERVRLTIGDRSSGLRASTFHTWCTSIIRRAPKAFGFNSFTVIDRDDQLQIFRVLRGKRAGQNFPKAAEICDMYSYARNTRISLDKTLKTRFEIFYPHKEEIASLMRAYEERKHARNYFDYDDVLDVVAQGISQYPDLREWLGSQYEHILVDEMQDTNPLQWELLQPLTAHTKLFCVGDDAQSIYGFRGADFRNVHSFQERVPGSLVLKLEDNYRSTQEILDLSNWLLTKSTIRYDKQLKSVRGKGIQPRIETFRNAWEEARWIAEDLTRRRAGGAEWRAHMILARSAFSARTVEQALLAKEIPYKFIGGVKLLESAHVRDVLSVLRIIANHRDEIAWMRFLTLWAGVGEVTASTLVSDLILLPGFQESVTNLGKHAKVPQQATDTLHKVSSLDSRIPQMIRTAVDMMKEILATKYKNQDWEKRLRDFELVAQLAEKHRSILEFLEEYILEPVYHTGAERKEDDDVVHIITIHSAKGTERDVCYVANVSPGSYPPVFSIGDLDDVEEERRVLYVALTRAKNELIVTRRQLAAWSIPNSALQPSSPEDDDSPGDDTEESTKQLVESYFLNELPKELTKETVHGSTPSPITEDPALPVRRIKFGIDLT
jgi:DNA helicase-2/ATP-dependent DNA helicase PcrA